MDKLPKCQTAIPVAPLAWVHKPPSPPPHHAKSNNNHRLVFRYANRTKNANHLEKLTAAFIVDVRYREPNRQALTATNHTEDKESPLHVYNTHRIVEAKRVVLLGSVDSWHRTKWHCMVEERAHENSRVQKLGYNESSVRVKNHIIRWYSNRWTTTTNRIASKLKICASFKTSDFKSFIEIGNMRMVREDYAR